MSWWTRLNQRLDQWLDRWVNGPRAAITSAPEPFFHDSWNSCTTYGKRYNRIESGHFTRIREDGVEVYLISDRTGEYPLRPEEAPDPETPQPARGGGLDPPTTFERNGHTWHRVEGFPIRRREDGVVVCLTERGDEVPCRDWGASKRYERWAGPGSTPLFELGGNEVYWTPAPPPRNRSGDHLIQRSGVDQYRFTLPSDADNDVSLILRDLQAEEAAELASINHRVEIEDRVADTLLVHDIETHPHRVVISGESNSNGPLIQTGQDRNARMINSDGAINVRLQSVYMAYREAIQVELRTPLADDEYLGVYYVREMHEHLSMREFEALVPEIAIELRLPGRFTPIMTGGDGPVLRRGWSSASDRRAAAARQAPQADGNDVQSAATSRSFQEFQAQIMGEAYDPEPPPPPPPRRPLGGRGFDL